MGDFPEPPAPEQARRVHRAILRGHDVRPQDRRAALSLVEAYGRRGPGWAVLRVAAWAYWVWQLYRVAFVPHSVGVRVGGGIWVGVLFCLLLAGAWMRWRIRSWPRRHPGPGGPGGSEGSDTGGAA